jgi:hypothetical protein
VPLPRCGRSSRRALPRCLSPRGALEMSPCRTEGWSTVPPHRPVRTPQSHSAVRPLRSLPVQCQLLAARSRTLFASAHALLLSFMGNSSTRRPKHGEARIFRSQNIGIFPLIGLLAIYPRPLSPPIAYHRAARPVEDAAAGRPLSTPCSAQSAYTELGSNLLGCLSEQNVPQGRRAFRPPLSERACTRLCSRQL